MVDSIIPPKPAGAAPTSMVDVAHKFVSDIPLYVMLGVVAALAVKGQASALEVIMGGMSGFLAKSWPKPVQIGTPVIVCVLLMGAHVSACGGTITPSQQATVAAYEAEQLACVLDGSTRPDIDACRNAVKTRYGRSDAGGDQ